MFSRLRDNRPLSLRHRVSGLVLALVTLFALLQGGLASVAVDEQEDELVDQLTRSEALRLAQRLAQDGPPLLRRPGLLPDHFSAWWIGPQGQAIPEPVPAALRPLSDGPHHATPATPPTMRWCCRCWAAACTFNTTPT